jgi:hypothetical protein
MLGAGIDRCIDVLPIHYSSYEGAKEALADAASGGVKSVWNDETASGISVWRMPGREALERSVLMSRYVMRTWPEQLAAGVDGLIYFGGEANPAGNWKYLLDDHTPRPVAATLAVMSAKLGDARPVGVYYAEPGARVVVFEKPDGSALAVVSSLNGDPASAPVEVKLIAPAGSMIVRTDHQGNATALAAGADGTVAVSAGNIDLVNRSFRPESLCNCVSSFNQFIFNSVCMFHSLPHPPGFDSDTAFFSTLNIRIQITI